MVVTEIGHVTLYASRAENGPFQKINGPFLGKRPSPDLAEEILKWPILLLQEENGPFWGFFNDLR